MELNLCGKKALVTGAGKGIGRGITKTLVQYGVETYAVSRTQADLDSLQQEAPGVKTILLDLSDWDQTRKTLSDIEAVDFLVNNAGIFIRAPFLDASKDEIDRTMNTNFMSAFNISQIFAKKMIATGKPGSIVNISAFLSTHPIENSSIYSSSKAALDMLTKCMAFELGSRKIRINSINPTATLTPLLLEHKEALEARYLPEIPLGRFAEIEDVVNLVLFLLSDRSAMITGESILVDGGHKLH